MDKAKEVGDKDTVQQAEVQLKNVQDELDKLMDAAAYQASL